MTIIIAQNTIPYAPDGEIPNYPIFDVSLAQPLPPHTAFIGAIGSYSFPPLLGYLTAVIGIAIVVGIIQAFKK